MPYKDPERKKAHAKLRRQDPEKRGNDRKLQREWQKEYRKRIKEAPLDAPKRVAYLTRNNRKTWTNWGIKFENEFDFQIWNALALYSGTVCAVTGITNEEHQAKYGQRLSLDHDHQTGAPRRFLSNRMNQALGFLENISIEEARNLLRLHEEDRRTRDDLA